MKHSGVVTGVREHHKGKHVVVDIAHGKRSPAKKGKHADPFPFDDRPSSSVMVPKKHAGKFPVGQRVSLGMTPQPDDDGDAGEDLDEMDARLRKSRQR